VPRQVRPASRVAVRIVGADFDELSGRFQRQGAVEGYAILTGTATFSSRAFRGLNT